MSLLKGYISYIERDNCHRAVNGKNLLRIEWWHALQYHVDLLLARNEIVHIGDGLYIPKAKSGAA